MKIINQYKNAYIKASFIVFFRTVCLGNSRDCRRWIVVYNRITSALF